MSDLAVKIRIADRDYPMRVAVADEERLRLAGRQLSERLREFREQYGIQDKQDLLAMVALATMADSLKVSKEKDGTDAALTERLARLDELLSGVVLAA
jgi:cell division protein ZapA